ncbi:hypothetical protein DSO57_1036524 [Entomophthora muscae]|uniref:Uncharacterized protein n=1 Tax=Entomophthora muscae TaxID=34485 RepID=A0ACC2SZ79_9FUNG|nr:hypothetical protein DSO57_1036524 [Entomophthora muscae]
MKLFYFFLAVEALVRPRVIRGYEATPFKYPFMVSVQYNGAHNCGGTLYRQDTVISAAHCRQEHLKKLSVLVHRHNLTKTDEEEGGSRFNVTDFISHPLYDSYTVKNDIAILKLSSADNSRTAILLDRDGRSEDIETMTTTIGWGLNEDDKFPAILMETRLPILRNEYCQIQYAKLGYDVDPALVICAGFPEGYTDTCQSDSGGPIFIKKNKAYILLGVVSWGKGCAEKGFPGYYTRISNYISWIEDTTQVTNQPSVHVLS